MNFQKQSLQLFIVVLISLGLHSQTEHKSYKISRTEVLPIVDSKNHRSYELYVKLPSSYSVNETKKYPILYITDAKWHYEIVSGATEYLFEDVILVGISWELGLDESQAFKSRYRDYSIQKSQDSIHQATYRFGGAPEHVNFIKNDVFKLIENKYRVNSNNRTYFGYSLGGLFGSYILMKQPHLFKNYILGSPSIKGNEELLKNAKSTKTKTRVFISVGSKENELKKELPHFIRLLKQYHNNNLSINSKIIEGNHKTAFPLSAINGIIWLSQQNHK